jgi:uncharacterized cupin superfamily protein
MKPILNVEDVALERFANAGKFEVMDGPIGPAIGARQLGCSLAVVAPGKRAYPFHAHHVNEELVVILEGAGVVRIGEREHPIRKGDVIAFPAGGRETAHQIINTSGAELRYLAMSTMIPMEVVEYPDSSKISVKVGSAPGDPATPAFAWRGRPGASLDYWDGE